MNINTNNKLPFINRKSKLLISEITFSSEVFLFAIIEKPPTQTMFLTIKVCNKDFVLPLALRCYFRKD